MLLLACLVAVAAAAPATYDQRQDGEFNVRADVQNVVLLLAVPQQMIPSSLLGLVKSNTKNYAPSIQERAGVHTMEAFLEPSTPYHVEIGETAALSDGEGRAVEVVIAGRRRADFDRSDPEPQPDSHLESQSGEEDEFKLIGAREQCGPEWERDPVSLICRPSVPEPTPAPAQEIPSQETPSVTQLKNEVIVS